MSMDAGRRHEAGEAVEELDALALLELVEIGRSSATKDG
jgi:hypothetical protein